MKLKRIVILIIFSLVFCITTTLVYAEKLELTLDKAIAIGLKNSASLQSRMLAIYSAEAGVKSAKGSYYPDLSLSSTYTHLFEENKSGVTIPITYTSSQDPVSISVDLSQNIFSFGKVKGAIDLTVKNVLLAKLGYEEQKRALVVDIKRAFYDYILAKEMMKVQEQTLTYKKDALDIAKERYHVGLAPDYDVLKAESDIQSFEPSLISAQNQLEYALLNVFDLLGIKDKKAVDVELIGSLKEEYTILNKDELVRMAMANNYSIQQYKEYIFSQEIQNKLNNSQKMPSIKGFASYSLRSGFDSRTGKAIYLGEDSWDGDLSMGMRLQVPLSSLFPWSSESASIKQGKLDLEKLNTELCSLESDISLSIDNIMLNLKYQVSNITSSKKSVELARRLFDSAKQRYINGLITSLEFQDTQVSLNTARIGYLESVHDYKSALFDLMDVIGVAHL